ncbi:MAG: ABC transporter permease, partial [Bacteroidetes bacterium]|nr:ABC transporter permease [Bacteroidota bacterium]
MIKNYLKISLRNLQKHKGYAFINIFGLAIGLACCLLIVLFVRDELSYDRFHEKADRTYRIVRQERDLAPSVTPSALLGPALMETYPEVEHATRLIRSWFAPLVSRDEDGFYEDRIFFTDAEFFNVFDFRLVRGDPDTVLSEPFSILLTETMARKYFGDEDPLGQTLTLNASHVFTVTGLLENPPRTTHFTFDFLASIESLPEVTGRANMLETWGLGSFPTYVVLPEGYDPAALDEKLAGFAPPQFQVRYFLQPLTEIHLASAYRGEIEPNSDVRYVWMLSGIALIILLLACINYTNLATARFTRRAREVGIRKVVGAHRRQLIAQFLGESVLLSMMALLVALALPWFNDFAGKALSLDFVRHWWYVPAAFGLAVVVGVLAGSYPAFLLSAFRPAQVLKGTLRVGRWRLTLALRRSLVVFQFALSIGIIAGTVVALQQIHYMRSQSLGFDQEQILVLPFNWEQAVQDRYETLKTELLQHTAVRHVTASGDVPGRMFTSMAYWIEGMPEGEWSGINALIVDPDFAETYGLDVVAGRDFSPDLAANLGETFILNEAAVAEMGLTPDEVIGKPFRMNSTGPVVGVMKDFHFEGLQKSLEPLVMTVWPSWFGYVSLRLDAADLPETLAYVERTWQSLMPTIPFEYFFLNDDFKRQYRAEERFGQVFVVFAVLAIFISCLGLFGLAAFTAEQRTKEIGVRKVLGASAPDIVLLLNRDVTRLVALAAVLATPVVYLAMQRWLETFAYRIDLSWGLFLLACLAA